MATLIEKAKQIDKSDTKQIEMLELAIGYINGTITRGAVRQTLTTKDSTNYLYKLVLAMRWGVEVGMMDKLKLK
jgi:hypothetical protein